MREVTPVLGADDTDDESSRRRWYCVFYQQWSGLNPFKNMNWRDFALVKIQGEVSSIMGRVELELALLGFGITVQYVFDQSFNKLIRTRRDEIEAMIKGDDPNVTIRDPFGVLDQVDKLEKEGKLK